MYKIIHSDVYAGLCNIDDNSIEVAITSPPYWGQRDYGFDGQIGNESSYPEYILKLTKIFSLLKDKLAPEGVFFLNIGDKYLSKYGKSPLALIPFQLAYNMVRDGWYINDILIWYKPNHMPSSIKNRFVNSYEPIFVFSKNLDNIFSQKKNKINYTNILKVNLKPTQYKHVAVYPEKLIENLLYMVELKKNAIILDPFAGSGTTLKVVMNFNKNLNAIMIENNKDYIEIIKERCGLNGNISIFEYDFIPYDYNKELNFTINSLNLNINNDNYFNYLKNDLNLKNGFVKIFENKEDYYNILNLFLSNSIKNSFSENSTFFIGSKDFDLELIYKTSLLNQTGWVIRNMVVVDNYNYWFPIFMIVDDNKKSNYIFNIRNLNYQLNTKFKRNWNLTNFVGYKVINALEKEKKEGIIVEIQQKRANGFPEYVIVKWNDGEYSKEFVIFSQEEVNRNILIKDNFIIIELKNYTNIDNYIKYYKNNENINLIEFKNSNYNGKYKTEKRINWGASPGARSSVEQEYFSMKRLYDVNQNLVADYLNYKRIQKGLTKQELINLFPDSYKHTIGHWLRKDFGGSIPSKTDWFKLAKILDIDDSFTNYVCKNALKIQTVKNSEYRVPKDFIKYNELTILERLIDNKVENSIDRIFI